MTSDKFRIAGLVLCLIGAALLYGNGNVWLMTFSLTSFGVGLLSFLIGYILFMLEGNYHGRDS